MSNNVIQEYNKLRYNNDLEFRKKKSETNKKYYHQKKYKITKENINITMNFN